VGTHENTGYILYTQHAVQLWDGFNVLWIVLGLFAIPQMMRIPQLKGKLKKAGYGKTR
jgi:TctA family transporter